MFVFAASVEHSYRFHDTSTLSLSLFSIKEFFYLTQSRNQLKTLIN